MFIASEWAQEEVEFDRRLRVVWEACLRAVFWDVWGVVCRAVGKPLAAGFFKPVANE